MSATVSAFFRTNTGTPNTGLSPTIRIWRVQFGSPNDQLVVNGDSMIEVGDGFYKYDFTTYDPLLEYVFRADGGAGLNDDRRYVEGATECPDPEEIWAVSLSDVQAAAGSPITTIGGTIVANQATMETLLETLLKYECNRTRIDPTARTLTIYDDDGTTPLKVFDLRDSTGASSVTEVCERDPQ